MGIRPSSRAPEYSQILIGMLTVISLPAAAARGGRPPIKAASFSTTPAAARLAEVRFVGSKRYSEVEIIRAANLRIGDEATPDSFQGAANKLAATGAFASVQYKYRSTSAGIAVEFQVIDSPKFIPCRFDNFVWLSADELQKELRMRVPLFLGEVPPSGNLADQLSTALETLLRERGVQGTVLQNSVGELGGPVSAILFRIEGVPIQIARVNFQGAVRVDSAPLQAAVRPLLGTDYSNSFVSDFARLNLGPIYHQKGFLKARFEEPKVEIEKNGGSRDSVAVNIPIDEGIQYRLKEIQFSGNSAILAADLSKNVHLKVGEPADGVQLQEDLKTIQSLYGARGYIMAVIRPVANFHDETQTVAYRLEVQEGDLYRMGKFEVTGVDASIAKSLQKLFRPRTGEPFDAGFATPFLSQAGHDLPKTILGSRPTFKITPNQETKTVDVFLTFVRSSSP